MLGKVTTLYMSEKERLAYIEKHPIKKPLKELRRGYRQEWRHEKGLEVRWGKKEAMKIHGTNE
jgi:hypothetical protein